MALVKSSFWCLSVAFIPVVCGNPCEVRNRGGFSTPGFIETGVFVETGDVEPQPVLIQAIEIECDEQLQQWFYHVEASGTVGLTTVYPRYVGDLGLSSDQW